MEFIQNYFLLPKEFDIKPTLDDSISYLKKATVLTRYPLSDELSYTPSTFYTMLAKPPPLHVSTDNEVIIYKILDYWLENKNNLNALQSGYVIFESHGLPCLVLSNSELHTSSHSYCQIINIDTIVKKYVEFDEQKDTFFRFLFRFLASFLFLLFAIFVLSM